MKYSLIGMTAWALVIGFAPVWGTGCGADPASQKQATGTMNVALTGTSSSGKTYRLRDATIEITGTAKSTVSTEGPNLDAASISVELPAGGYLAELEDGWFLEVGTPDPMTGDLVFTEISAVLTSVNPLPFVV